MNEVAALGGVIAGLVKAATDAGDFSRAEALCRDNGDSYALSEARLNLVRAYARTNNFDRADEIGPTIGRTYLRAEAYGAVVRGIAESGNAERAEALVETFPDLRPAALTGLAWAVAAAGRLDHALDLAHQAQQATHSVIDSHTKDRTACELIEATTAANGHSASAEAEIAVWIEPERLDHVAGARVRGLISFGDLGQAERHARTIAEVEDQSRHLIRIAEAAIAADDRDHAQRLAEDVRLLLPSLPDTYWRAEIGADLANIHAALGDGAQVRQSVADAEGLAESIELSNQKAGVLGSLANAMLVAGDLRRAEDLMRAMSDRFATERAARVLVETAVKAGKDIEAVTAIARSRVDPEQYDWLIRAHVRGLVHVGDLDQAERLADAIQSPDARAHALTDVAARRDRPRGAPDQRDSEPRAHGGLRTRTLLAAAAAGDGGRAGTGAPAHRYGIPIAAVERPTGHDRTGLSGRSAGGCQGVRRLAAETKADLIPCACRKPRPMMSSSLSTASRPADHTTSFCECFA